MDRLTTRTLLVFTLLLSGAAVASSNSLGGQSLSTLLPRQDTCGSDNNSVTCNVGSFCCPTNTRCIPVENATSVVCCKVGEICDEIFPITCSTTTLSTLTTEPKLDSCGTQCCPVGYECGPDKDRCIMKEANLPADYVKNREDRKNSTDEALLETCKQFITLPATSDEIPASRCPKFTWEGVLVGLFPGIAIGLAIMLVYIKAVEIKTRRRTIHFNGRLSAMPEDYEEKLPPPPVPVIGADVRERYSSNFFSPSNPMVVNPTPALTNEWKPRELGNEWKPRNFSGSSNPILEGRGSAMSRSTNASSTNSRSPAPYPLSPAPRPAPASQTVSPTPAPYIPTPEPSTYKSGSRSRPSEISSVSSLTASDFSAAVTKALRGGDRPDLDEFSEPMKARVMDVNRPISLETGYTASFYQGGEGLCHPPFVDEEEVPPLRFKGGLQPIGLTGRGLGWDDNRF